MEARESAQSRRVDLSPHVPSVIFIFLRNLASAREGRGIDSYKAGTLILRHDTFAMFICERDSRETKQRLCIAFLNLESRFRACASPDRCVNAARCCPAIITHLLFVSPPHFVFKESPIFLSPQRFLPFLLVTNIFLSLPHLQESSKPYMFGLQKNPF